jgi:glycosyltransferase involved in cell wall biosynthesis
VNPAPVLIPLVSGLTGGGIATCARKLAEELVRRGRSVGLIVHGKDRSTSLPKELDPRVRIFDLRDLPPPDAPGVDLAALAARYEDAARDLAGSRGPVVVLPSQHGECYGLCARLSQTMGERGRIVGWRHSAFAYDRLLVEHYQACLSRAVAVGPLLAAELRSVMPGRADDIVAIPNAVDVHEPAARTWEWSPGRVLKLIYVGRMEEENKRVGVLVSLAGVLRRRGIPFEMELIGDGPALDSLRRSAVGDDAVKLPGLLGAPGIRARLEHADLFMLASRVEGMSMSLLEAMERGCVPLVSATAHGGVIRDGWNGVICDLETESDAQAAEALADGVVRAMQSELAAMAAGARQTIEDHHTIAAQVDAYEAVIDAAAASAHRPWPSDRPWAFAHGGGTVPPDAISRASAILEHLGRTGGARVAIHGSGAHTLAIAAALDAHRSLLVAIADDDSSKHGRTILGLPVIAPAEAASSGATDVVISSWLNQDAIWARRAVYERQGLRVHRIYGAGGSGGG